jgi:hypothetical protein
MPFTSLRPVEPRHVVHRAHARRRFASTVVALAGLALVLQVLASCGGGPPDDGAIREAAGSASNRVYWAGRSVAGLPLSAMETDGPWITFDYGDCRPDRDENCSPPLTIQTLSICDLDPLEFEALPRASKPWRHLVVREYGDGRQMVDIGASTVIVHARGSLAERALHALRAVGEAAGTRLLRARYPRELVVEVRRVDDAYRRLGSIRRVRDELRISQKAIRFRLVLAKELGPTRLHQPAGRFLHSHRDLPVMSPIKLQSSCKVEPF